MAYVQEFLSLETMYFFFSISICSLKSCIYTFAYSHLPLSIYVCIPYSHSLYDLFPSPYVYLSTFTSAFLLELLYEPLPIVHASFSLFLYVINTFLSLPFTLSVIITSLPLFSGHIFFYSDGKSILNSATFQNVVNVPQSVTWHIQIKREKEKKKKDRHREGEVRKNKERGSEGKTVDKRQS